MFTGITGVAFVSLLVFGLSYCTINNGTLLLVDPSTEEYVSFLSFHGKSYSTHDEFKLRFEVYKENKRYIDKHNKEDVDVVLKANLFADFTHDEYLSLLGRKRVDLL